MKKIYILTLIIIALVFSACSYEEKGGMDDVLIGEVTASDGQRGSVNVADLEKKNNNLVLDLSSQSLEKVPAYVFDMKNLEELDLSNNNLTGALPSQIGQNSNLKKLNVSGNNMTGIPAEVGNLKKLEELDYADNQITGLPLELANLENLRIMDISGNDYSEFDLEKIKGELPNLIVITEVIINKEESGVEKNIETEDL